MSFYPRKRVSVVHVGRAGMLEIESGAAAAIVDSSSENLLDELRRRRRALASRPFAIAGSVFLLIAAACAPWPGWAILFATVIAVTTIIAAGYRDRIAKTTEIVYELEPHVDAAFRRFTEWAHALARAGRMWHVAAAGGVANRKYHAGANAVVQRNVTMVRTSAPPSVKTNVPVLSLGAGRQTLYFLPDRLLVYDAAGIGAISYRTLDITAMPQRFVEEESVPRDATVVDRTWRYVNKSGGPDRRFRDNREIPICLYDELTFRTSSGLYEVFQVSQRGLGEGFVAAVRYLASVTP
ncbi:MAG TPA: hypothetical protein VJZ00_00430 [Thermoanaerobaculia bacterium]|nr:hypothetical protein [Thermoanaerobaculia bacterium]